MKCHQALQALQSDGPQPLAEAHVAECESCQRTLDDEIASDAMGLGPAPTGGSASGVSGSLELSLSSLDSAMARERGIRGFARGLSTPVRRAMIAVAALGALMFWRFGSPRADVAVYPVVRWITEIVAIGIACAVLLVLASRPSHRASVSTEMRTTEMSLAAVAIAGVLFFFALAPAATLHPTSLAGVGDDFARRAIACFMAGSLTAAPILGLALWADRWAGFRRDAVIAACAGAFLVGTMALHLHCPISHKQHLFAGHYAVLIPMTLIGLLWLHLANRRRA